MIKLFLTIVLVTVLTLPTASAQVVCGNATYVHPGEGPQPIEDDLKTLYLDKVIYSRSRLYKGFYNVQCQFGSNIHLLDERDLIYKYDEKLVELKRIEAFLEKSTKWKSKGTVFTIKYECTLDGDDFREDFLACRMTYLDR